MSMPTGRSWSLPNSPQFAGIFPGSNGRLAVSAAGHGSYHDISNTWLAHGLLSSSRPDRHYRCTNTLIIFHTGRPISISSAKITHTTINVDWLDGERSARFPMFGYASQRATSAFALRPPRDVAGAAMISSASG